MTFDTISIRLEFELQVKDSVIKILCYLCTLQHNRCNTNRMVREHFLSVFSIPVNYPPWVNWMGAMSQRKQNTHTQSKREWAKIVFEYDKSGAGSSLSGYTEHGGCIHLNFSIILYQWNGHKMNLHLGSSLFHLFCWELTCSPRLCLSISPNCSHTNTHF